MTKLDGASVIAGASRYLSSRFPLHLYGPAILLTYYCVWWLYDGAANIAGADLSSGPGAVSLVLIFLQARLIDDLEDQAGRAQHGAAAASNRTALTFALFLATAAVTALNWGRPSLYMALAPLAVMLTASGIVKPLLTNADAAALTTGSTVKDVALFLAFESAHLFTILYIYIFWRSLSRQALPTRQVACVTVLFWAAYVFWKYARCAARPDWNPFGMGWRTFRLLLIGILALCLVCNLAVTQALGLAPLHAAYACIVFALFTAWLASIPQQREATALRSQIGLLFVGALDLGLILASIAKVPGGVA